MKGLIFVLMLLSSIAVYSQVASPTATPSGIVSVVQSVDSKIPSSIPMWALGLLAVLSEFAVRIIPSAQPRSILLVVSAVFKSVSSIFSKVSGLLDTIVQNIKQ